jgi:hypothetical protein
MKFYGRGLAILVISWGALGSAVQANWISTLNSVAGADGISYWNLQESSGDTAADAWTTGFDGANHGTISGIGGTGVTVGAAGPRPSDGFAGFSPTNNALAFGGNASQLLQMASGHFAGKTELTMLMWFTSTTSSGSDRVLGGLYDKTVGAADRYAFLLNSRSSPLRAGARVWNGASEIGNTYTTSALSNRDGDWHFAVLTMEAEGADKQVRIYFDGAEVLAPLITGGGALGLPPRQTSTASTAALTFGNDLGDTARALVGRLDEIAFINRSLTAGEVGQLWQSALVPEPNSFALMSFAMIAGVAVIRRRRIRAS